MISLSGKERVFVFAVGFVLGIVLIGFIHQRRAAQGPEGTDSMAKKVIRDVISSSGIRPLPDDTPEILRQSTLYSFDVVNSTLDDSKMTVWNLQMLEGMWPWVRVSEKVFVEAEKSPEVLVMAGDRVLVTLRDGVAEEQFDAALETQPYQKIGFYKRTQQYVVSVEPGIPIALDIALKRLSSLSEVVESAKFHELKYF